MTAIKRASTADDVVGLVMFLPSDAASFISGQTILARPQGGDVELIFNC
jgi:NAD(P)-dependent dehydrogenase (short-subunit alcohol dehydrogenase family)